LQIAVEGEARNEPPRALGNFPGEGVPLRIRSAGSQWSLEAPADP